MRFPSDLPEFVSENEPLATHIRLGIGGPARWLARPRTTDELTGIVRSCLHAGVDIHVLGLGANLLVSDEGVDGMVVRLAAPAFRLVDWGDRCADGTVRVTVGAGADMSRLALDAARHGLSGLECMAGIPGRLGGIIRMNAGGRFGEIGDVVRDVTVIDREGCLRTLSPPEVGFRYRGTDLGRMVVLEATLTLERDDPEQIRERFLGIWQDKKKSQPLAEPTAGCVFKNPPGHRAGELIDRAGFKNHRVGGAFVSDRHANFIIAQEGATARDVFALIGQIRRGVAEGFGVELELEVEVWGHQRAISHEPAA